MAGTPRWRRVLDSIMSIGSYPGEPEIRGGARRVLVVAFIVTTLFSIPSTLADLGAGYTWVVAINLVVIVGAPVALLAINFWPYRFASIVTAVFVLFFMVPLGETVMFGGLLPSGLSVAFGLALVLGALLAIGLRAAIWWLVAFAASVVYAVVIPDWVDPIYQPKAATADAAFNLIANAILVLAALAYFARQRDRFQQRSDNLLRNILPDEIADRLKDERAMIADDFTSASVLFADVVGFTPMSAEMAPSELVGLLNDVFTRFDEFVDELGLEKIKTVGDEYMVAAGVPKFRPDHAQAIAELALRIQDHVAANQVRGHRLTLRIGISSGPVTAGIIGTHKFAYDLWGDTVNTASRMESEGVPGSIQMSPATYELIRDAYVCEARGLIPVKGMSEMMTYLLISKRETAGAGDPESSVPGAG